MAIIIKKYRGFFMSRVEKKIYKTNQVNINRLSSIKVICFVILIGLTIRLFYIQIINHDFYKKEAMKQRQINIPIDSGRGIILDRNFIPLTDREEKKMVIIFPQYFNPSEKNILYLQKITDIEDEVLTKRIKSSKSVMEFPLKNGLDMEDVKHINTRGLFIVDKKIRYEEEGILSHVIGYINQVDKKGMYGIEGAMDGLLSANSMNSLIATVDGLKRFIPGEGYAVGNDYMKERNLRLTIDYSIQKILEDVMSDSDGAIVVSDIKTGEILGMVSRPNFNPNNISEHMNSDGDELYNKAIQMAFPPGSIFKIVVAIEAIIKDPSVLNKEFHCLGYEKVGDLEIKCSSYRRGGHGDITLERGFAESCNSVFIQLAESLGADNIINRAKNLGFGDLIGIGLKEESKGNLPYGDYLLGPSYANIAIGQGEILATPLQVNQLTQCIANNGIRKPLYLIKDVVDGKHNILQSTNMKEGEEIIDAEVVKILQDWMHKVMTKGSGYQAKEIAAITAGKTGSAESVERKKEVVHAWFTGYYPFDHPKYAITVLIQNGRSGGGVAVPIFKEVVERMMDLDYK